MGRFVGDRIFPKEHRRTGVYTTTCFCNDERNTTCVCVVCVRVCISCTCRVPPYIQWVYMERGHYFCGLFFFPLFFLGFHVRYLSCLRYVHVCIASATYPFYNVRYLGKVGLEIHSRDDYNSYLLYIHVLSISNLTRFFLVCLNSSDT